MKLSSHLTTVALQLNSSCLRIVLSRDTSSQFSVDALRQFHTNLAGLSAIWYLIKPAVDKSLYKQAKNRLKAVNRILVPELDRMALLDMLDELLAENRKPKVQGVLRELKQTIQEKQRVARLDIEALSLALQKESRCWRELAPISVNLHEKIQKRFVRCYGKGKSITEGQYSGHQQAILEALTLPRWRRHFTRLWHQLDLIRMDTNDVDRARHWYAERLAHSLERSRLLEVLLKGLVRPAPATFSSSSSGKTANRIIPKSLQQQVQQQQHKLVLRQLKLYECIYGQTLQEYSAFIAKACKAEAVRHTDPVLDEEHHDAE